MDEHHSWYNESVWHRDWSHQAYIGQLPIFYGSVILLHILKTIWWRNIVFWIIGQCDIKIDLVKYMWVSDHWFCLMYCYRLKLFLYFKKCIPRTLPLRKKASFSAASVQLRSCRKASQKLRKSRWYWHLWKSRLLHRTAEKPALTKLLRNSRKSCRKAGFSTAFTKLLRRSA